MFFSIYNIDVLLNHSCIIEVRSQVLIWRIVEKLLSQVEEFIGIVATWNNLYKLGKTFFVKTFFISFKVIYYLLVDCIIQFFFKFWLFSKIVSNINIVCCNWSRDTTDTRTFQGAWLRSGGGLSPPSPSQYPPMSITY